MRILVAAAAFFVIYTLYELVCFKLNKMNISDMTNNYEFWQKLQMLFLCLTFGAAVTFLAFALYIVTIGE